MRTLNQLLGRYASFAPLIIRVIIGGLFVLHGIDKFRNGISGVEGFFDANGVPVAGLTAPLTAVLEIGLGAALIVGLATRLSALVLTVVMIGAILFVKADGGILGSAELDLSYIAGLAALILLGPGRLSVDEAMANDETVIDLRSSSPNASPLKVS